MKLLIYLIVFLPSFLLGQSPEEILQSINKLEEEKSEFVRILIEYSTDSTNSLAERRQAFFALGKTNSPLALGFLIKSCDMCVPIEGEWDFFESYPAVVSIIYYYSNKLEVVEKIFEELKEEQKSDACIYQYTTILHDCIDRTPFFTEGAISEFIDNRLNIFSYGDRLTPAERENLLRLREEF